MKKPEGALIEAIESDMGSDHAAVVALLRSGYKPTDAEWEWFARFAPMGTPGQASKLVSRDRLARARNRFKELRASNVPVETAKQSIEDEFHLTRDAIDDYVVSRKNPAVVLLAKRLENAQ